MKVVLLAGGMGYRLREETEIRPKPMVEIGGLPILWHIMKIYAHYGLTEFIVCLGYKGYVIKDFFLNYEARMKDFTVQLGDRNPIHLHTAHAEEGWAVTLAETGETALTGTRICRISRYLDAEAFCLTYGDGLADISIMDLIRFHQTHGKLATVTGVHPVGRFGELRMKGDRVISFDEKPQVTEGFINGGFFVFQREFVDRYLDDRDDLALEQGPLQRLAAAGELMVYRHEGFWQPMDTYREWKMLADLWNTGKAPWKVWK